MHEHHSLRNSLVWQTTLKSALVVSLALSLNAILVHGDWSSARADAPAGRSTLVRLGSALELYYTQHRAYPNRLESMRYRYEPIRSARGAAERYVLRDRERYPATALWDLPDGTNAKRLCESACNHLAYDPQFGLYGER